MENPNPWVMRIHDRGRRPLGSRGASFQTAGLVGRRGIRAHGDRETGVSYGQGLHFAYLLSLLEFLAFFLAVIVFSSLGLLLRAWKSAVRGPFYLSDRKRRPKDDSGAENSRSMRDAKGDAGDPFCAARTVDAGQRLVLLLSRRRALFGTGD